MVKRAPYRKRELVREEILQAAQELFATRPPSDVSLREIAEHGGFQHSLITRHFGTKDDLIAEVVQRTLAEYVEAVADCDDPVEGFLRGLEHVADHPASYQAMTRQVMDDTSETPTENLFARFATHRAQLEHNGTPRSEGIDLDVLTIALMAFTSGWAFMEDRWLLAAGFDDSDRSRVRAQIADLIERLIDTR